MLSRWIEDLESADLEVRSLALQDLQQLGPEAREAVPALIAALQKAQGDPHWRWRNDLIATLGAIGPDARPAVPLLVSLMDPSGALAWEGTVPAFAILRIGGEPFEERLAVSNLLGVRFGRSSGMDEGAVLSALTSQNPVERIGPYLLEMLSEERDYGLGAASTLANYGAAAVPLLLPLLRQHTGQAQTPYILALQAIGEPSIPALRQELRGPSVAGRVGAARTLGLLAPRTQDAFEDLVAVLDDGAAEVRYSAAQALVRMDASRAGAAVPHLVAGLESAESGVRGEAAHLLALLAQAGRPAEVALPALGKLLTDPEARLEAAQAMVEIDAGQAVAAIPVLVEARVLAALVRIDASRPGAAVLHLVAGLECAEVGVRGNAANLLALLAQAGRPAEVALPALGKLLTDPEVRLEAALAMVEIDAGQAAAAVPVLVEALERSKPLEVAESGIYSSGTSAEAFLVALGRIGRPAAVAVPLLRQALPSPNEYIRADAAVALVRIAPEFTPDAVSTLLPLLSDGDLQDTFWKGIGALAEIGPGAREAVPPLEEWLFEEEKRGMSGILCPDPGEPVTMLFSALLEIDPTASARILAHLEADLQSPERFLQAVRLLLDLSREVPASAPLLARLLVDNRAEGQWDLILATLGGPGPTARDVASLLREQLESATPERASRINDVLARIGRAC